MVSKVPLKHRDDLSRAYTPGVARVCLAIAKNPADARRLTIKRNTVAVVTDGTAVLGLGDIGPGRRDARDGGKGRAVQALRRRRRLAGGARHQGHRHDRGDRQVHRTRLRRDQSRGHLRPALLRDRAPTARTAGHPGVPRRPARHRDRGARRADQRAAGGQEEARRTSRSWSAGSARPGTRSSDCWPRRATPTSSAATGTAPSTPATRTWTSSAGGSPTTPIRAASRAPWRRCSTAQTSSSACPRRIC